MSVSYKNSKSGNPRKHTVPTRSLFSKITGWYLERTFLATFLTSLFMVAGVLITTRIRYGTNDDIFILLMLKGVGFVTQPSETNIQLNILLSKVLKNLYILLPSVQWYTWLQVSMLLMTFWGILYSLQQGAARLFKTVLFILCSASLLYCLFSLQWNITAILAGNAGVLLLYSHWMHERANATRPVLTLSFALLSLSALLRDDAFFFVGLLWIPNAVYLLLRTPLTPTRAKIVRFLALTIGLLGTTMVYDYFYYHGKPEWAESIAFYNEHCDLTNYHVPHDTAETPGILKFLGWTQNDFNMLQGWYFIEKDRYTLEKLKALGAHFPRWRVNKDPGEGLGLMFMKKSTRVLGLTFLLLAFFVPPLKIRTVLWNVAWVVVVLVVFWLGFKIPERIHLPMFLFLLCIFLIHAAPNGTPGAAPGKKPARLSIVTWCLLAALGAVNARHLIWMTGRAHAVAHVEDTFKSQVNGFTPRKDACYVVWQSSFPYEILGAFDSFELFRGFNIVQLAWFQRFPVTQAMLDRFGVKNLLRDMMDNPRLFLICTPRENNYYQIYMREKYSLETTFETVFSTPFFKIEKIRSIK
jgi:hypothetical protein